jgi:hypothetical protein
LSCFSQKAASHLNLLHFVVRIRVVRTLITDARYFITSDQTEYLIVVNLTGKYMILSSIHLRIRYMRSPSPLRARLPSFVASVRAPSVVKVSPVYIRTYVLSPKMVSARLGHAQSKQATFVSFVSSDAVAIVTLFTALYPLLSIIN